MEGDVAGLRKLVTGLLSTFPQHRLLDRFLLLLHHKSLVLQALTQEMMNSVRFLQTPLLVARQPHGNVIGSEVGVRLGVAPWIPWGLL